MAQVRRSLSIRRRVQITLALVALIIGVIVVALDMQTWESATRAMIPTVDPHDRVVAYSFGETERGDIVLYELTSADPSGRSTEIARVVAL